MTRPARFAGTARREFAKALRDMEHAAAAQRLRQNVERAARRIGERPLIGRLDLALADARYRFWSVSGFAYPICLPTGHVATLDRPVRPYRA